jgi:uncharacterized damage-inducible protein DinB
MHVLDAYRYWFLGVYGHGVPFDEYPLGKRYTRAEAVRETREVDRVVRSVLGTLTAKDLDRALPTPGDEREKTEVRVLLVHMIEEELQHRGEMNALLWQAGADPPVVGFNE